MHCSFFRARTGHTNRALAGVAAFALAAMCFLGGCADIGSNLSDIGAGLSDWEVNMRAQRIDLVAQGQVQAQAISGPGIEVSLPSVFSRVKDLNVFGTVTRKSGNDGPIPGFLEVSITTKDGELFDSALIHWVPESVPTDGTRSARYSARILGVPPAGSTVLVTYIERVRDLDNLPAGSDISGGGGSGGSRSGGNRGGGSRSSFGSGSRGVGPTFGSSFGRH